MGLPAEILTAAAELCSRLTARLAGQVDRQRIVRVAPNPTHRADSPRMARASRPATGLKRTLSNTLSQRQAGTGPRHDDRRCARLAGLASRARCSTRAVISWRLDVYEIETDWLSRAAAAGASINRSTRRPSRLVIERIDAEFGIQAEMIGNCGQPRRWSAETARMRQRAGLSGRHKLRCARLTS